MKKFFNYVLLALVTVCFALPLGGKAEAAKVAVVPLANHVAGDELAGTIYMQEALALFRYPEFDLLGEDVVLEAIAVSYTHLVLFFQQRQQFGSIDAQ